MTKMSILTQPGKVEAGAGHLGERYWQHRGAIFLSFREVKVVTKNHSRSDTALGSFVWQCVQYNQLAPDCSL